MSPDAFAFAALMIDAKLQAGEITEKRARSLRRLLDAANRRTPLRKKRQTSSALQCAAKRRLRQELKASVELEL